MKKAIMALAILPLLLAVVFADDDPPTITVQQVDVGPPAGYEHFIINPGFENGYWGWEWEEDAEPGFTAPLTGVMHAALCADPYIEGTNGWAEQGFSIVGCADEPLWFKVCTKVFSNSDRPPEEDYTDVMEIWLTDYQNLSFVSLGIVWDVDDHGQFYECDWVRVEDMPLVGYYWTVNVACVTNNSELSPTAFVVDDLEGYCRPNTYTVFLPLVRNGE
jgi:hypothetical protein